ncbi:MAG: restriction endonuclease [Hyphomonadaceae bacterium]|nr:restriction endonuclease [Hyphomonadaceae bacterium]
MREIPIELAYPKLVWPTLELIRERGGSASIEEIEEGVAKALSLPEHVLAAPHTQGSRTEFQYRLAWVRTYLKKDGILDNSERAVWSLTERGDQITESEARSLFARVNAKARTVQNAEPKPSAQESAAPALPEDNQDTWIDRLLELIGEMSPAAFERLAQRLLRESGFTKVEVTGKPGDGGIDGIGILRMNLVSFQVSFQCKRWKDAVGASAVRDFRGAMVGRGDKGLIITTSTFTADARREATRDGAPAIDLIDGETLCHLLKERRLGVGVQMVEEVALDEAFFRSI